MSLNHKNDQFSTHSELGEVKAALGRLYKEFENLKQSQKADREKDRAEITAWAQTNLIQNQLLSKAMITIELLTNELKNQGISWKEFEQNNADFQLQLIQLSEQSQNMPKSSLTLESLEIKGIKSEVSELKQNWNDLVTHTKKLTTAIQELQNNRTKTSTLEKEVYRAEPFGKGCLVALGTGFVFLFLFFVINQFIPVKISDDIHNYLQSIWQRTGYRNTKLQRVERYLGTDHNRQK